MLLGLLLPAIADADSTYTESVTFAFDEDEVTYSSIISTAFLLVDDAEGMNPLCEAIPMSPSGAGEWSTLVTLPEGDYIYVFVANADSYVDLSDCGLNPDDVPDSNFFNDPHPLTPGFGGQFGKDNMLAVRSPDRPRFVTSSVSPMPGSLVTSGAISVSAQIQVGASGTPIDLASARVRFERTEPSGIWRPSGAIPAEDIVVVTPVEASSQPGGATISTVISEPPEGFHRVFFDASGTDGLAADTLATSVIVNRDDEAPVADAGPTRFGSVGGAVQLDGSGSLDPDRIGFAAFTWRVIEAPGSYSFRYVDEEEVVRDGFGIPVLDDNGLQQGTVLSEPNATPQFLPYAAGRYVIGLRVTDQGGNVSSEDTTDVWVVESFDASTDARVVVTTLGSTIFVDGRTSSSSGSMRWIADATNPSVLELTEGEGGKLVSFPTPSPGTYFLHLQVGNSYPTTAVVRVDAGGKASGSDFTRPPRFFAEDTVLYLVFPREFEDIDGNGVGDFDGLAAKLPYLRSLGVNALWLMPVTPGPTSHGYAATAHFLTEEDYGTLTDFAELIDAAHAYGMQVVFDLVANHTSNRHPFFEAAERNADSPLRPLYVWNADGTYQYAFDFSTLPSMNYNNPLVRRLFLDTVDYWMDQGVDSIRADIAGFVPPSFWRAVRRLVRGRSDEAVLLAEIIPPNPGFFDGEQFDIAYDAYLFWNFKDLFATTGGLDGFDAALDEAERFIQGASVRWAREKQDPSSVLRMRYLDNQDEDRFLLKAGREIDRQRAAAGALLTLPGVPMIFYGDETGAVQMRGPMKFDANPDLLALYRRLLMVRRANAGLRGQDSGTLGENGDTYVRINSDADLGGYSVFSFARYREGQRFVVLVNRFDTSVLGTQVTYWPPPAILEDYPDGSIYLQNHLDPEDVLPCDKLTLAAGFTSAVGAYETKVYQVVEHPIPDSDADGVLDSWDNCLVTANQLQDDGDGDGVGDACDLCAGENGAVSVDGCLAVAGAPRVHYEVHDGHVDDESFEVTEGLFASWNGRELYVATSAATPGFDRFVLVVAESKVVVAAPFGKSGTIAGKARVLADEGENDYAAWLGATGQARAGSAVLVLAESGDGAVLEGTLNLQEQFGAELPARIGIAAVEYDGQDGGGLSWQAPASTEGDGDVDDDELIQFELADPTPPPPEGETDTDGDGLADGQDNCPGFANPDQDDFDDDGVGDLCDLCPASAAGSAVDGEGCAVDGTDAKQPLDADDQAFSCACRMGGKGGPAPAWLALVMLGFFLGKRRMRYAFLGMWIFVSCTGSAPGGIASGERMVTGRIELANPDTVNARRALALVALFATDDCTERGVVLGETPTGTTLCGIFGEPFDPGVQGGGVVGEPFQLELPCDETVNLIVQTVGTGGGQTLGDVLGVLVFPTGSDDETTTLLAREPECRDTPKLATNVLELGSFEVSLSPTDDLPAIVVGGPSGGENPLATIDTDQDLSANSGDTDDDQDGTLDESDADSDGDGMADADQVLLSVWLE